MFNVHSDVKKEQSKGINIKPSKEGSLHTAMHVKQGNKIPASAEQASLVHAKATHNTSLVKKLVFAINARKFKH